ncbi:MAG: creatininase family protein [Thermovirgaceae bacterium]|jgi:creatinine amidohydrolase|nr:creatininase family protein [Synergistales bacterium]MDI9391694.1 creatininase family protein [Synergistota bacterium]MDY0178286.1 creatininase family protein [Synergistaceae bacterium]HRW86941.1 creatininase family protein [Thermovirgaceae bacterium]MDD3133185.1 creatininase family protein [Synergistales bacterium]
MKREVNFSRMSWFDVQNAMKDGCDTVMIPVGSVEQHGPHLPLTTDSMVVDWIANKAAEQMDGVLVAPIVYYGVSYNHIDFPGTGSVQIDTLKRYLIDVCISLLGHGFEKLIILNGHGGNNATVAAAAHDIRLQTKKFVGVITWPSLVLEAEKTLESEIVWHADEGETSTVLWIAPELVKMERALNVTPKPIPHYVFTHEALFSNPVDQGLPPTKVLSESGIVGDAKLATPEKGKLILEEAAKNLAKVITELRN